MDLIYVVESSYKIKNYIERDSFFSALSAIADNELDAARFVLSNLSTTNRKTEAINRALTHLESSFQHYKAYNHKDKLVLTNHKKMLRNVAHYEYV